MKIAVYTIALNEAQFVERWYQSAKQADYLLIADTGSTDLTVKYAKNLGINIINIAIKPWRFDDARNAALAALPGDVDMCIALDMDEQLQPRWRQHLEPLDGSITRPRYQYTWSWNLDGTPGLVYGGDKIHARNGYRWKHPVHEVLTTNGLEKQSWIDLEIHHHPDNTKSRSQYLPLLEMAVAEAPDDDRNAFYYARDLFFNNRLDDARLEFIRHLALPSALWEPERAASMRYLAKLSSGDEQVQWLEKAIAQAPGRREALVDLAQCFYDKQMWAKGFELATQALAITQKPLEYLCEADAWGYLPHDLAAICAHYLGLDEQALAHGANALEIDPQNSRLLTNMKFYREAIRVTNDLTSDCNTLDALTPVI